VFADVHYVLALTGSGELEGAARFVASMREAAKVRGGWVSDTAAAVGLPLADGMLSFAHGQADRAVQSMLPLAAANARLGGSRAQRDVFALLLIEAANAGSRPNVARALIEQRLAERPRNRFALQRVQPARVASVHAAEHSRLPRAASSAAA
jgi:hypothetical protein